MTVISNASASQSWSIPTIWNVLPLVAPLRQISARDRLQKWTSPVLIESRIDLAFMYPSINTLRESAS